MTNIEVVLDQNGILLECKAAGHSRAGKTGADIVCAAISVLMRTAVNVLSGREGIKIRYDIPESGSMSIEIEYEAEGKDFLYAAGMFLVTGLGTVAKEFPENCKLNIKTKVIP